MSKRSDVIYRIPCGNCDSVYIGETSQYLSKRLRQHKHDVSSKNGKTALCQHVLDYAHTFKFDDTTVLANEEVSTKRKVRELIEINEEDKSVNYKSDLTNLSHT